MNYYLKLFTFWIYLCCQFWFFQLRVESRKHLAVWYILHKLIAKTTFLSTDWETTFYLSSKTLSAKFFLTMIPLLFFAANCYSTIKVLPFLFWWRNNCWLLTQFSSRSFPLGVNWTFWVNIGCDNFITSFHCFQRKKYQDH